jgi:putative nucleotidyltransferase with HDIG domain/predicted Zn finger-like uncharacterized protein
MRIVCPQCQKEYDIPDERLRQFGEQVRFPCPACKATIAVALSAPPDAGQALPAGDVLKKRILRTVSDLPPMPQVAQKARELTADERSSFQDMARVIETDQAIAARVLKISNSAYYGQMGKVTSIQHASVVLGMKTLNELLTLACAGGLLGRELKGYGLSSGDLWQHSLAAAGCARSIARKKKPEIADDAFSAGLIHDCGKLILDPYIAERREQFDACLARERMPFLAAEKEVLGFDHAQIAAEVCQKWQIPDKITRAIAVHHMPSLAGQNELAYVVHAADSIALMCGIGSGIDGMLYEIDAKVMSFLQLDSDEIGFYMAEAAEFVEKTAAAF